MQYQNNEELEVKLLLLMNHFKRCRNILNKIKPLHAHTLTHKKENRLTQNTIYQKARVYIIINAEIVNASPKIRSKTNMSVSLLLLETML